MRAIGTFSRGLAPVVLAASLSLPAHGTPPRPPARLMLGLEPANEIVLAKDVVPIRIAAGEPRVSELVVTATLTRIDPAKPDFAQPPPAPIFERRLETSIEQTLEIPVSLDQGQQALLDVRLTGKLKHGGGFSDRLLRTLRRDADGRLIISRVASVPAQRQLPGTR